MYFEIFVQILEIYENNCWGITCTKSQKKHHFFRATDTEVHYIKNFNLWSLDTDKL